MQVSPHLTAVLTVLLSLHIYRNLAYESLDPYATLEVSRGASQEEIRKSYKKLARQWHPDKIKSSDESDSERFMKINQAYEILGDEKKKREYDQYGRISDNQRDSQGHQFFRTPFGSFQFRTMDDKYRITQRLLHNTVIPDSYNKPYLFFATTDFCFNCMRVQPIWDQFVVEAEAVGLSVGTIDVDYDGSVAKQLKVPRIPCIGAVVSGRSVLFDATEYNLRALRDFTRKLFPTDLVLQITSTNYDEFLSGWQDNRVRVIFFGKSGLPTLRLIVALNGFTKYFLAGYVDTRSGQPANLIDTYDVPSTSETILIFKESIHKPALSVSRNKFGTDEILNILRANKYLTLPRVDHIDVLRDLCPESFRKASRKYCVILTFAKRLFDTQEVNEFRHFADTFGSEFDNLNFLYLYSDIQISPMTVWNRPDGNYKVLMLARKSDIEVQYDWLNWCSTCESKLQSMIVRLDAGTYDLKYFLSIKYEIRNEIQKPLYVRIVRRLYEWWDYFTYKYFDGDYTFTLLSLLSTMLVIAILTVLLRIIGQSDDYVRRTEMERKMAKSPFTAAATVARYEWDTIIAQHRASANIQRPGSNVFTLYDLKLENFDKLVRDAPSGYRFIVLLVDEERREQYMRRFTDLMRPFNNTPYFWFGLLSVDKYLVWYKRLLLRTVGDSKSFDDLNPSLCVGTVLAINGYRKYYNIYHPKTINIQRRSADFIGFDDSSSDEDLNNGSSLNGHSYQPPNGDILLRQGRILDGLGHWIDRLFDGSLPKCKVDSWPIFPVSEPEPVKSDKEKKDE